MLKAVTCACFAGFLCWIRPCRTRPCPISEETSVTEAARQPLHLAVALDGAGWHPAAWREPGARPAELLSARYWADVIGEAEHGLLDFVTIEDSLGMQSARYAEPDPRTDQVRGRLDAVLIAARVAPVRP